MRRMNRYLVKWSNLNAIISTYISYIYIGFPGQKPQHRWTPKLWFFNEVCGGVLWVDGQLL